MDQPTPTLDQERGRTGPGRGSIRFDADEFPWWLAGILLIIGTMAVLILRNEHYREAFVFVVPSGLWVTFQITIYSFVIATVGGLFIGLGRVWNYQGSRRTIRVLSIGVRNLSTLYIEFIRGIPALVFIFVIAFVVTPDFFVPTINKLFGADLVSRDISFFARGLISLSLFYAAFIAEVFRAGIQSVPIGQVDAGKSVGLSSRKIMRLIVLPQAIRNMLPALGNDLISLMKDTSLLSVLAVRELTQMARLYSGSSFRFREAFFVLTATYVTITLVLSLILRWYEKRIATPSS